ncbi:uncharacterized protein STEHIDRAFT_151129 [Stereum hirsutum FP-91666 SS1]|uniref:uncharacterized protein n=1 Tax=Stereum hirsutum (strain FP-91666) TaxID=721885 RepID=UPI000440B1CA|nr:uncharacterized protein STEHIDRAFT_151129 [Stereum hirsutum FP-91666 SS1]EIM91765.1 hypothetical protein STEHIDRAFT_151129 [Stereum hirsutum FP-91666 SS1]
MLSPRIGPNSLTEKFGPYRPPVFPPSPEEENSSGAKISFPDKSNHAACARFRLRRKARPASLGLTLRTHALLHSHSEDSLRIVALERQVRDLRARIVQLDHDFKLKLSTPPLSPPPLPADASAAVPNKASLCLTIPSFSVTSLRSTPNAVTTAFARTSCFAVNCARKVPSAARHLPLPWICCVLFAWLALIGWWKALSEHSGDVPSVLRVDRDMEETLGVEGLSSFVHSLGFDPNPVYLPLDRDEYLVDIAAAARDL